MRILSLLSASVLIASPAFAADLGVYRPGTPYNSTVASSAEICDHQCSGDAQCRGWNYVKPNPRAPGVCEFLSSVSTPIASQISISGEGFSSRGVSPSLTAGGTNTVRVGTPVQPATPKPTISKVAPPQRATQGSRRIVRQAVPQRLATQSASTQKIENQSLTTQQNRFRQAPQGLQPRSHPQQTVTRQSAPRQSAPRQIGQQQIDPRQNTQRQINPRQFGARNFPHILDGGAPAQQRFPQNPRGQQQPLQQQRPVPQQPQVPLQVTGRPIAPGQQISQNQRARRQTGPRSSYPSQNGPVPQQFGAVTPQQFDSRPAKGAPIPAPQSMAKRSVAEASIEPVIQTSDPVALSPEQAGKSLYGRLHDDVRAARSSQAPSALRGQKTPPAGAAPTTPVESEPLEVLAGGL